MSGSRGGRVTYLRAALTSLRDYRPVEMAVSLDGADAWAGPAASVVVCNGASFGGGMRIAPSARPDDGLLDVVWLGVVGRLELARWLPTVYWGGHLPIPGSKLGARPGCLLPWARRSPSSSTARS